MGDNPESVSTSISDMELDPTAPGPEIMFDPETDRISYLLGAGASTVSARPVASAILTMARADVATVFDIRALVTLHRNGHLKNADPKWAGILASEPTRTAAVPVGLEQVVAEN
jgi:hypothetical protein